MSRVNLNLSVFIFTYRMKLVRGTNITLLTFCASSAVEQPKSLLTKTAVLFLSGPHTDESGRAHEPAIILGVNFPEFLGR